MDRRDFLVTSIATAAATSALASPTVGPSPFKLRYAPHLGMFRVHAGEDPADQIRFMADEGFTAFEDNGLMGREPDVVKRITRQLAASKMMMGVFVGNPSTAFGAPTFTMPDPAQRDKFILECKVAADLAQQVGAKWMTFVPGDLAKGVELDIQTANVIDMLRRAVEVFEPKGLVMVLEPLNPWRDHPGMFLSRSSQAYMICKAVNSPACKILFDIYHQQITEGNLIPNIDRCWDHIAYFQIGDNPGRNEPGTGEINYRNIFKHLHAKGYQGVLGMEHGNSQPGKEGERAVIDAYRACDQY